MFRSLCSAVILVLLLLVSTSAEATLTKPKQTTHQVSVSKSVKTTKGAKGSVKTPASKGAIKRAPKVARPPHHSSAHASRHQLPPGDQPQLSLAEREEGCLTKAIYWEAKSETSEGQAGVGYAVKNRMKNHSFPSTACGVVYQKSPNKAGVIRCQFSWVCNPPGGKINAVQMAEARRIAQGVLDQSIPNPIGDALYFQEVSVTTSPSPRHAPYRHVLGRHAFFSPTPMKKKQPTTELVLADER